MILKQLLEHDFSQNRDEGLRKLFDTRNYLRSDIIDGSAVHNREIITKTKDTLERILFGNA